MKYTCSLSTPEHGYYIGGDEIWTNFVYHIRKCLRMRMGLWLSFNVLCLHVDRYDAASL